MIVIPGNVSSRLRRAAYTAVRRRMRPNRGQAGDQNAPVGHVSSPLAWVIGARACDTFDPRQVRVAWVSAPRQRRGTPVAPWRCGGREPMTNSKTTALLVAAF